MYATRPLIEAYVAAVSLVAACVTLGGCAATPLIPYSADTPPLVLAPASQVGVKYQRMVTPSSGCTRMTTALEPNLPVQASP